MAVESFGRYEIIERIGRGGMASIFRAKDPTFGREVALKVLPREFLHDPSFRGRFERESRTIATLEHSAIVPVYDFGEDHGQPYLVMRLMRGGSLADRLRHGAVTLPEATTVVSRIGAALDYAHDKGIVHRDLKPGNILFDEYGQPFLADFGIVKVAESTMTLTGGGVVGTPAYMSPEQVHGDRQIDGRSDIYSLGVILYEMLTGATPYMADTPAQLMMAHVLKPTPRVLEARPDLPAYCNTVIETAMAKDRDRRYETGGAMAKVLREGYMGATQGRSEATTAVAVGAEATIVEPLPPEFVTGVAATGASATGATAGYRSATPPPTGGTTGAPAVVPPNAARPVSESGGMGRVALPIIGLIGLLLCCVALAAGFWQFGGIEMLGIGGDEQPTPEVALATATSPAVTAEASTPAAGDTPAPPTLAPVGAAISNLDDVRKAVVQIVARGSFVDPEFGEQTNAAGSGSGFIIDPSGLAVTNNHVVAGAATLDIYLDGESEPRNARVLGVSECSDLAMIDIDGDGFPFLAWYDGPIDVGMDVYTAGYPLGDPEFTLTRGIISKSDADGNTSWASVDRILEHDATINPGNSGGPLLTPDGRVVGINYAGVFEQNQYFAVARDEALAYLDKLRTGEDVTSIGIAGTAVSDGAGMTGVWVSSVTSGSPADAARIEPGDIITSMESFVLATDGTMADFCDILRTKGTDATLSVEVLRYATGERLAGQLNGDELVVVGVASDGLASLAGTLPSSGEAYSYTQVSDNTGQLSMEVPTTWNDLNGNTWTDDNDQEIGPAIAAAPSLDDYYETWDSPGVFFGASRTLEKSPAALLDESDYSGACTYAGRFDYSDSLYTGMYDLWTECGDNDSVYMVLYAMPEDSSFVTLVAVQAVTAEDLEALNQILATFLADI